MWASKIPAGLVKAVGVGKLAVLFHLHFWGTVSVPGRKSTWPRGSFEGVSVFSASHAGQMLWFGLWWLQAFVGSLSRAHLGDYYAIPTPSPVRGPAQPLYSHHGGGEWTGDLILMKGLEIRPLTLYNSITVYICCPWETLRGPYSLRWPPVWYFVLYFFIFQYIKILEKWKGASKKNTWE